MNVFYKIFSLSACGIIFLFMSACAETPDGTIVLNEQTVENFFEDGNKPLKSWNPPANLNLLMKQPVAAAEIPQVPEGMCRIEGTLDSAGRYKTVATPKADFPNANLRGSTFRNSVFGMVGPAAGKGNAWFYADVNPQTGEIINARAYLYGFNDGVCDMRKPAGGSFGTISSRGFTLSIDGYCAFPDEEGSMFEYALLIEGQGGILTLPQGAKTKLRYIVDNNGKFTSIPARPQNIWQIYDYGDGYATLVK